ncbi:serine carboxypeptidase s28 domain-containing protein [Ditylenchus destructor]|uniref:Serine carboxypeptidase s28 domain-containing protein n=1 Tax=Ditylenchus destructor TaxID=166010 RepID=A0AAD4MJG0_9BILA|nr:serine carboxypeptidase s28 domain-containing protein [Ditylenchus destructor]
MPKNSACLKTLPTKILSRPQRTTATWLCCCVRVAYFSSIGLVSLPPIFSSFQSNLPKALKPHERRDPKKWVSANIEFGLKPEIVLKVSFLIIQNSQHFHRLQKRTKESNDCSVKHFSENILTTMNWKYFDEDLKAMNITPSPIILGGMIEQYLDHFNQSEDRKFYQHYLYNKEHATNDSVNFLFIGGEAAMNASWLSFSYMKYGEEFGANLYVLEHRYYGNSHPFRHQPNVDMQYLSSEQALADAGVFISTINEKHNITNPKWIVFGCSYSGNLAAWMRQKYSDLVLGAVAGSSPVQAKLDFRGYNRVSAKAIEDYGTENCTNDIRRYFSKKRSDVPFWFINSELVGLGSQSDDLQHNNIKKACEEIRKKADVISNPNKTFVYDRCDRSRYDTTTVEIDDILPWFWQTCTEFGYYQTVS